jgi:hypothetical protein
MPWRLWTAFDRLSPSRTPIAPPPVLRWRRFGRDLAMIPLPSLKSLLFLPDKADHVQPINIHDCRFT